MVEKQFTGEKEISFSNTSSAGTGSSKVTISGYCETCHTRYNNVPLIEGVPQCPVCIENRKNK